MKLSDNIVTKVIAGVLLSGVPRSHAFTVSPIAIQVRSMSALDMSSNSNYNNDKSNKGDLDSSNGIIDGRREFLAVIGGLSCSGLCALPAYAGTLDPKKKYYRESYFEESRDVFRSPELRAKLQAQREASDPKLIAKRAAEAIEAKRLEKERLAEEKRSAAQAVEEEKKRLELLATQPPEQPRVLVLGGTGAVGSGVRKALQERGIFVLATSRDGRDNTIALDVTKSFGKVSDQVNKITKDNRISAVVSCIGGVNTENDAQINGATGQAALGARNSNSVRNFVALGPSPSLYTKTPKGLETYVKTKEFSQSTITNKFVDTDKTLKYSYTIINPGAIGKSKNYGTDPSVPLKTVVDAVTVGALAYYLDEQPEILNSIDEIKAKAQKIDKVNQSYTKAKA